MEEQKVNYRETRKIGRDAFAVNLVDMADCAKVLEGLVAARQWANTRTFAEEQDSVTAINSVAAHLRDLVAETYKPCKFKVVYEKPLRTEIIVTADSPEQALDKAETVKDKADGPDIDEMNDIEEIE